ERAVTAELSIEYKKPVSLHDEIVVEGWQESETGRNRFRVGEIRDAAGNLLARGRGRFVVVGVPKDAGEEFGGYLELDFRFRRKNMDSKKVNGSGHSHSATEWRVKVGLAEMLKGGVIMDVTNAEQASIAEKAGACAVMALERVPSDIRKEGG